MARAVKNTKENTVETKDVVETVSEKVVAEKKEFKPTDMIVVSSITPGEMFFEGAKSKFLYTWADADDVVEIEFRDLDYAARSKDKMMTKPRFIIQDKDFLAKYPFLEEIYSGLYSTQDLRDILKMSTSKMEKAIASLPDGAKDSVKVLAATMIDNGTLGDINVIKKLDEIFDTQMLMKLLSV